MAIDTARTERDTNPFTSGVSWGAVLAGAFVAAALALILLVLGSGLGFSAASPWQNEGASAKTLGIAAMVWMVFVHLISSATGGYMAGRLRTRWTDVHNNEVFFRDTAHGLTAWAVGVVITAALLTSAATAIVGGAVKTGAATVASASAGVVAGAASGTDESNGYFVDMLFRGDGTRKADDAGMREEASRILSTGLAQGELSGADRSYLAQVIAARTDMSPPEAEKRVADVIAQAQAAEKKAKEVADEARKAAAYLALWSFLALLVGAFVASYAATMGGRQRDSAALRAGTVAH